MIPKECKRLAEVDFPIAAVSAHSAREKSIRHGHPSTLHLWWARRPLAACRAMLMALLLPDPCDANCPTDFKKDARRLLALMPGGAAVAPVSSPADEGAVAAVYDRRSGAPEDKAKDRRSQSAATMGAKEDTALRKALLSFIADFANWDNSAKPAYLECARGLVKAAHGEEPPLVVDPFAGGGSIPLEALRIGCDAFASDLNPVACLILKVLLEDIPRHGPKLAEELRTVGKQIKGEAEKELAEFYPPDPDGARPIAYLWARTVRCEAVGCGAEIPLMRSFWLCKKANRRRALKLTHERDPKHPKDPLNALVGEKGAWRFEIYEPKSESEVHGGTVTRGNAACPCCNTVLPVARVRTQLAAHHGGADVKFDSKGRRSGGARMLAVVTKRGDAAGREYRLPKALDYTAVRDSQRRLGELEGDTQPRQLAIIPNEPLLNTELRRISIPLYGCTTWGDVYSSRQKLALAVLCSGVRKNENNGAAPQAIGRLLALAVSKLSERLSAFVSWIIDTGAPRGTFARQAVGMVWDYLETVPVNADEEFPDLIEAMASVIDFIQDARLQKGQVESADAVKSPLPSESTPVWFTDPPYYDSVPYAHLSDLFYVWLKRSIGISGDSMFNTDLTPKENECVVDRPHRLSDSVKTRSYFESKMTQAMTEGRRVLTADGVGCVVFAHKTTEGWEALLGGMLHAGFVFTGSWPITTERGGRLNAQEQAALGSSVHLVCRPRSEDAAIGGWEDILRELPNRIGDWMERLSGEGIRGADLVFSCIGPALELFSKYDKVETAEGREVKLPEFLAKVWEVVGRTALQQVLGTAEAKARNSAAGALEEDARLTALFLWTLQSTDKSLTTEDTETTEEEDEGEGSAASARSVVKGFSLIYDVARRFAQPLGIHMENWEGRIIETKKGIVRLIPVLERAEQLSGGAGMQAMAMAIERSGGRDAQFTLFPESPSPPSPSPSGRGKRRERVREGLTSGSRREATTLDRVHAAMLLQAGGQAGALRALLEAESQRSPDFLRLANALSALYPKDSEEKRLLDAMLLALRH